MHIVRKSAKKFTHYNAFEGVEYTTITGDTMLSITRNTSGNSLPGYTFECSYRDAVKSGYLSTDGGTMEYSACLASSEKSKYPRDIEYLYHANCYVVRLSDSLADKPFEYDC